MEKVNYQNLEDRLINFAISIISLVRSVPDGSAAKYLAGQVMRSGIAPALNYGEARSAESVSDFIHKMKIALKELRETMVSLKILKGGRFMPEEPSLDGCTRECNELISIFVKSIQTAEKNRAGRTGK